MQYYSRDIKQKKIQHINFVKCRVLYDYLYFIGITMVNKKINSKSHKLLHLDQLCAVSYCSIMGQHTVIKVFAHLPLSNAWNFSLIICVLFTLQHIKYSTLLEELGMKVVRELEVHIYTFLIFKSLSVFKCHYKSI